ncbi:ATP-binding cassette domain-containing protein [Marivita sp.]|uniref:ATP-binding cassette domain-containing protein n=1 Tax=Marivita sp. TaxID=2003365 RepID=UPI003F6D8038
MSANIPALATQQAQPASVHPRPALELQDASVVFGSGDSAVTALSPTNIRMDRGDFLALVGPSGCGKSTILKLVSNLIQPSSGLVLVGGKEAKAKELRIGMAFQNPTM